MKNAAVDSDLGPIDPSAVRDPAVLQRPVPHVLIASGASGKKVHKLLMPEKLLGRKFKSADDVKAALAMYESGQWQHYTNGTVGDRRWHAERIRPALRFLCRQFDVKPPPWLAGNYEGLSDEDRKDLFGSPPLAVREFKSWGELTQHERNMVESHGSDK